MHTVQLSSIDLNLLLVLASLLETGSVKEAAAKLSLSPSATSHALARLRDTLGDPILVRAGRSMVLTDRAEALAPRVRRIVEEAEAVFRQGEGFEPRELRRSFRILAHDYGEIMVVDPVSRALAREAPGVNLYALSTPREGILEPLRNGEADFAIGATRSLPSELTTTTLFRDSFVCLLREGHPALGARWTKRRFASLEHVLIAPRGVPWGVVDEMLAEEGLERRVARTVASFLVAPRLLVGTDYVLTIARRMADRLAPDLGLVMKKPPIAPEGFDVSLAWHRRHEDDAEHRWLRELIAREAR
jgi:DNA-binding transcriptional LysR family regulator